MISRKNEEGSLPYGVYDLANNQGWVSVGITHDTAYFAAKHPPLIRIWAANFFRGRNKLMITADGGGSNGSRSRLWKVALQGLADRLRCPLRFVISRPAPASGTKSRSY